jgi:hypothetical protein
MESNALLLRSVAKLGRGFTVSASTPGWIEFCVVPRGLSDSVEPVNPNGAGGYTSELLEVEQPSENPSLGPSFTAPVDEEALYGTADNGLSVLSFLR